MTPLRYTRLLIVGLALICKAISCQNIAANWFFGIGIGLTFTNSVPTTTPNGMLTNSLGCAAVSGTAGNLLFYTDGINIYNQSHTLMPNGTGLFGQGAFQPAIIVKQPLSANLYYVFTVGGIGTTYGLHYSIVDMNLAAGAGSVIAKNQLISAGCKDKLSVGKHCNQQDLWILSYDYSNFQFVSALLSSTGISTIVSSPSFSNPVRGTGQLKVSPNSNKIAINSCTVGTNYYFEDCRIFDFNTNSGAVNTTSVLTLAYFYGTAMGASSLIKRYGCEFSQDSRYCYFTFYNTLSKIDLCAPNPLLAGSTIYLQESNNLEDTANKRSLQLAPDGKIYVALNGKTKVGRINNPQNIGSAATFSDMTLGTYTCQWGLPNYPGFLFERKPLGNFTYSANSGSCLTGGFNTPNVCSGSGYTVVSWQWNFGDPLSGTNNFSTQQNPNHAFTSPGTYTVSLIRNFACNGSDTIIQSIAIGQPTLNVLLSSNVCSFNSCTAQVIGGSGQYNYQWSNLITNSATATFTSGGVKTVTVTDVGFGCTLVSTFSTQVVNLTLSVIQNSIACYNKATGSATAITSGGSGTYITSWNGGTPSNFNTISALAPGSQTVLAFDPITQCTISTTFTILQAPALNHSISSTPGASACVSSSCYVQAYANGGTPPYNFSWVSGPNSSAAAFTSPVTGSFTYTSVLIDGNNCADSLSIVLSFLQRPSLVANNISVCKDSIAVLQCSGATNYTWQPGNVFAPQHTVVASQQSSYTITGVSNSCTSSTVIQVNILPRPSINITSNSPICEFSTLSLFVSNNNSYSWSGPNQFSSNSQNPVLQNTSIGSGGIYSVAVTNNYQCSATGTIPIVIHINPTIQVFGQSSLCIGAQTTLSVTGATNYTWLPTNAQSSSIIISPTANITYTLLATNSHSCSTSALVPIQIQKCLSLSDQSLLERSIHLYPNPTADLFWIKGEITAFAYRVISATGQIILAENDHDANSPINLTGFPNGMYAVILFFENYTYHFAIVKG